MSLLKSHRTKSLAFLVPLVILALILLGSGPLFAGQKKAPETPEAWSPHPYVIHPMLTTVVDQLPLALMTYLRSFGKFITIGSGFFYIEGIPGHHIIVDTGAPPTTFKAHGFNAKGVATTEQRLAELGLKPSDIDMVILTHLHFDHCENLKLFKKAKVVVQKSELEGYINAPVSQAVFYTPEFWQGADFMVVDGDVELFPGLWVLYTPGHSVGGQSVLVDTKGGRHIILGLCACDINIQKDMTPGIHTSAYTARNSMMRVKRMADHVITMHDVNSFKQVYR